MLILFTELKVPLHVSVIWLSAANTIASGQIIPIKIDMGIFLFGLCHC
jgi:hypothetical protein